jgi:hypothetical protein
MTEITAERLREVLDYDPLTGRFTWRVTSRRTRAGQIAGRYNQGYWKIGIDGKLYLAHRLAWLYMTGEFPTLNIDHIDRDGTNNRWSNLREATQAQNLANSRRYCNNKGGFKGVLQRGPSWLAQIQPNGRPIHLGMFPTPEAAHAAYMAAARKYFGEFANGGSDDRRHSNQHPLPQATGEMDSGRPRSDPETPPGLHAQPEELRPADWQASASKTTQDKAITREEVDWLVALLRSHNVKVINKKGEDFSEADAEAFIEEFSSCMPQS